MSAYSVICLEKEQINFFFVSMELWLFFDGSHVLRSENEKTKDDNLNAAQNKLN